MQSNMSLNLRPKKVQEGGSEPIVQGNWRIIVHGGFMHLQQWTSGKDKFLIGTTSSSTMFVAVL